MITQMTTMEIIMGSDYTMEERQDLVAMPTGKIKSAFSRKAPESSKSHTTRMKIVSLTSSLGSEKVTVVSTCKINLLQILKRPIKFKHIAIEEMLPHSLLTNYEYKNMNRQL